LADVTDLPDKQSILYIRCSKETKRRFATYVKIKDFKDYESALKHLLSLDVKIEVI